MPIIVDGWNLIRDENSPIDDDGDSLGGAMALIKCLERFQRTHKDPLIIVFDSRREFLGIDYDDKPRLKIVASKNADKYIKDYIENIPYSQRPNTRVVSSDKDVYYNARSSNATPLTSAEFWKKLRV